MSFLDTWRTISVLIRYWIKGRFTRAAVLAILLGEGFSVIVVLFVGSTFLSFSNRFSLGSGLSDVGLSLIFALFLVGLIQSGFNGSGLPVRSADVDYVFTSPVPPREVFAAKVLMNSFTTVLLSFPPILALFFKFSLSYGTSFLDAVLAGLVTLVFLVMGLLLSADITLSLGSSIAPRLRFLRNALVVLVVTISLVPIALLIPGSPPFLGDLTQVLPSGLAAGLSVGLVNGTPFGATQGLDLLLLLAWFAVFLLLGFRMSRNHFYEVLQVTEPGASRDDLGRVTTRLDTTGRSVWSVVRLKERLVMVRTKEMRALLINALFLSGFLVIYSLSGVFQSSPTSFLFILFILGSFGSGTATRWLEKERLWIIKTSAIDLRGYVKQVYRARVTPLLLVLTPVTVAVGVPLILSDLDKAGSLLSILLALPGALEIAAITMGGGMYFASRYGQSTTDDILSSQTQELTDIRRFLYQTVINLALVSPLMGLVVSAGFWLDLSGQSLALLAVLLVAISIVYTCAILVVLLNAAGDSLRKREDL
ncbi:MAG: putative ABC exporter domain-containing protein [Thaumarchaeota archaeon]|nr:putative ABC exporter domain-containing protein [Nitrososphaerota archaeon]